MQQTTLATAQLGQTGLEITRVGFGAWAIAHDEAPADLGVEVALDLIYGPVYHRLLHGHAPLTNRFAASVIDLALAGILTSPSTPEV